MPEHWEVRRNGRLFNQRNETGFADLPILEVSLRTGVRVRNFESSDRKQVMSDRNKYKRAVAGNIAYNMMRMWQGAVGVAPTDGLISPAYLVAKPLPGTTSRYFIRLFRTAVYMTEIDEYSRGIVKDRNRLYWEDFKRMPSCYPPPHEQTAIANAIDRACEDINVSIQSIRLQIDFLRGYRTRLIADVVTGKLDVREAAMVSQGCQLNRAVTTPFMVVMVLEVTHQTILITASLLRLADRDLSAAMSILLAVNSGRLSMLLYLFGSVTFLLGLALF